MKRRRRNRVKVIKPPVSCGNVRLQRRARKVREKYFILRFERTVCAQAELCCDKYGQQVDKLYYRSV